jgi:hypothetical protein
MTDEERETLLRRWTKPPSNTEDERAENACRVVRNAIQGAEQLAGRDIDVFLQGSYHNNTNVRLESDVDICVCLKETCTTDYDFAPNLSDAVTGYGPATYLYGDFKNDVGAALAATFGGRNVSRGNKAFNVRENTYRVTADVVACVEHLRYEADGSITKGTSLFADSGDQIENFPVQHHKNGVRKNNVTGGFFKDSVRMMKNLRNAMVEDRWSEAEPIASFFNECLVWNTPSELLMLSTWTATMRAMLVHLWEHLESADRCGEWGQVSELLYLFKGPHALSREEARAWVGAAWTYLEFE